jgi:AraC family transcriptional regulator
MGEAVPLLTSGQYFGRRIAAHGIADVTLTETAYGRSAELPAHRHAQPYFCLVLEGGYRERGPRRTERECESNALIFHPASEAHSNLFLAPRTRCFNLELGDSWAERMREAGARLEEPAFFRGGPPARFARQLYREVNRLGGGASLAVEGFLSLLLAELARGAPIRKMGGPPGWLTRCAEGLEERFRESLRLGGLAREAGVHPVHLCRAFRLHFGTTVGEHVRGLRLRWVKARLEDSETPIAELASASGWADQSHLTRAFAREVGMTPARYRLQRRRS